MAATEIAALSAKELKDFDKQKEIVTRGMHTFVEVGHALRIIRDNKYYREEHKTFEAFCKATWDIEKSRAYQLIDAAGVTENLSTVVDVLPTNERHVRPLTQLESPEQQAAAWEQVVETAPKDEDGNPKITAAHVAEVVEEFLPEPEKPATPSIIRDAIEREVPKAMRNQHALAAEIQSTASKLDAVKKAIEGLVERAGGEFLPFSEILEGLKNVKGKITQARYWSECPRCRGKVSKKCDRCEGHGFLPYSKRGTLSAEDKAWLGID